MPTKRKFSAKFPTARIKKIMQLDEEVGKVAATVPPVVSRAMELMIEQLVSGALEQARLRNSKTVTTSHLKHVIESEPCLSFARKLVAGVSDLKSVDDSFGFPAAGRVPRDPTSDGQTRGRGRGARGRGSGRGRGRGRGRGGGQRGATPADEDFEVPAGKKRKAPRLACVIDREILRSKSVEERLREDQRLSESGQRDDDSDDEEQPRKRHRKSVTVSVSTSHTDEEEEEASPASESDSRSPENGEEREKEEEKEEEEEEEDDEDSLQDCESAEDIQE